MMSQRAARLAEVEKLSRKPHQELHANLLEVVLGSFDKLTPEEWLTVAKRSPDRLIQALAMTGKLAGFSEKQEIALSGLAGFATEIEKLSDMELDNLDKERSITHATAALDRLAAALPTLRRVINALTPGEREVAITALRGKAESFTYPAA
jgi:hypothetical protein